MKIYFVTFSGNFQSTVMFPKPPPYLITINPSAKNEAVAVFILQC
jgi:hypothetical protein